MPSKLRVVIVNNFSGPSVGRYGLRALPLIKGLQRAGATVEVVAAAGSGFANAATEAGANVTAISMSRFRAPQIVAAIRDAATRINANIISGTGYFTNILVRQAAFEGAKIVNTASRLPNLSMDYSGGSIETSFRSLLDNVLRDRSDAYVAISQVVADQLIENGVDPERITIIPNGIDADGFAAAAVDYGITSKDIMPSPSDSTRPMVFCAARNLDATKGIDVLAEAAAEILLQHPDTEVKPYPSFFIAGSGPEKTILQDFVKSEELTDHIIFIGYAPLIAPWYKACDIVVIPSRAEASAVVALEAMALSRPVIATCIPANEEVVIDGVTGILVPSDDPHVLAQAIQSLAYDTQRAQEMGHAGNIRLREHFSEERMIDAYLELFNKLVDEEETS